MKIIQFLSRKVHYVGYFSFSMDLIITHRGIIVGNIGCWIKEQDYQDQ